MRQIILSRTAILVSTLFSAILIPAAHGQTVESLVFTEVSPTQLTESLNGVALGSWSNSGGGEFLDSSAYGIVSGQPPSGTVDQYSFLQFADPANSGDEAFVTLAGNNGIRGGEVLVGVTPINAVNIGPAGTVYPTPGLTGPNLTPTLPFSETDASVSTPAGPVDVNITFVAAPDHTSAFALMLIAASGLFLTRKHCRPT